MTFAQPFNDFQRTFNEYGEDTSERIDVTIPSFRLRIFGSIEDLWQTLWTEFPETDGQKYAGCVIGDNPFNVFVLGLRQIDNKLNPQTLILGHEIVHLLKQVIADRDNGRDTDASIVFNPDDLSKL